MPSWIFKQPNGLYGRFSTVVDGTIAYNGTREEWFEELRDEMGVAQANAKLDSADKEWGVDYDKHRRPQAALYRWKKAVSTQIWRIKEDIPHSRGNLLEAKNLLKLIVACGDTLENWRDEFAKSEDVDGETVPGIDIESLSIR